MRVIKHGMGFKNTELAFICSDCGCYFVAYKDECGPYLSHKCPDCSAKVYPFSNTLNDLEKAYQVIGQLTE